MAVKTVETLVLRNVSVRNNGKANRVRCGSHQQHGHWQMMAIPFSMRHLSPGWLKIASPMDRPDQSAAIADGDLTASGPDRSYCLAGVLGSRSSERYAEWSSEPRYATAMGGQASAAAARWRLIQANTLASVGLKALPCRSFLECKALTAGTPACVPMMATAATARFSRLARPMAAIRTTFAASTRGNGAK